MLGFNLAMATTKTAAMAKDDPQSASDVESLSVGYQLVAVLALYAVPRRERQQLLDKLAADLGTLGPSPALDQAVESLRVASTLADDLEVVLRHPTAYQESRESHP